MTDDLHREYIDEVKQLLKNLEQSLLQLGEKADAEEVNNVYRYLHTIKGSAGMFGFMEVERLAHELESVYSDIREGTRPADEFILDLTFHAADVLNDLLDGKDAGKEAESIIRDINNLKSGDTTISETQTELVKTEEIFAVILKPESGIFKRGVNLQSILDEIKELGKTEFIIHNESIPFAEQLAARQIVSWVEIMLSTSAGEQAVKDVFLFMKEVEYRVLPITDKSDFTKPSYHESIALNANEIDQRLSIIQSINPLWKSNKAQAVEESVSIESLAKGEETDEEAGRIIRKSKKNGHVSVATQKLDQLINIVSELVIFRSEMQHLMENEKNPAVVEAIEKLERLTLKLRDSAFNIRLVPLNILNVKLQRLIRSVSKELDKEVEFITEGLDTELDRSMINALEAPLMHIIRNAIDHGIEKPAEREKRNKPRKGLLKFYSYNSGDHVFIQLQDDGNGIDFEKIRAKGIEKGLLNNNQTYSEKELVNVMMTPGFSTADKVTTVSGRGVGMDVVKKDITALRGDIEVSTEKGLGSIFTIRLPLTLTILDTLVVKVSDNKYLLPINEVEYCFEEENAKLFEKKSRHINYKGLLMPFVSLREFFGMKEFPKKETVIVINKNDTRTAIVVDSIVGKLQTVYKPLNELLHGVDCFSGASILGDGSMALILNALKLKT